MTVSIILSGIIPVASVFADGGIIVKVLISALGASVTGINVYLNLKNYKNLWNVYRSNRELLLRTLYLYFNGVGVFEKQKDQDSRDAMLIDMCCPLILLIIMYRLACFFSFDLYNTQTQKSRKFSVFYVS